MTSVARTCSISWCSRSTVARGYCVGHYKRWTDGVDLEKPFRDFRVRTGTCSVQNCQKPDAHRGMCKSHYSRMMKYNLPEEVAIKLLGQINCNICGTPGATVVDHDHACCADKSMSCGRCIRGLICQPCNKGLGDFRDDPARLANAIKYLTRNGIE